jgi:hypothetical protein
MQAWRPTLVKALLMTQVTPQLPSGDRSSFRVMETQDVKIRELSLRAAQMAQTTFRDLERRSHQRLPYPRLIPLTPLSDDQLVPSERPTFVVGKHLSPLGLDFFHHDPIPQRYAVTSLEIGPEQWVHFLTKITWCRFLRCNWYDSGGRFVKVVEWSDDRLLDCLRHPFRKTS